MPSAVTAPQQMKQARPPQTHLERLWALIGASNFLHRNRAKKIVAKNKVWGRIIAWHWSVSLRGGSLCKLRVARGLPLLLWHAKITGEQARPRRPAWLGLAWSTHPDTQRALGYSKIVGVAPALGRLHRWAPSSTAEEGGGRLG